MDAMDVLLWPFRKIASAPTYVWLFLGCYWQVTVWVKAFAAEVEKQTHLLEEIRERLDE